MKNHSIKIFLFHRVNLERDPLWDPMDPALFERTIRYVSKNYNIGLLEDLLERGQTNVDKESAAIVFDDGYKDNIEYAIPILEKYNIKASFYIVTDCIDCNLPTWTYILDYRFNRTKINGLHISYDFLSETFHNPTFRDAEERIQYVRKLKPLLKQLKHNERMIILKTVDNQFNDVEIPKIMMDWDDVRKINNSGHYIGSHSLTHAMLGTMDDETLVKSELNDSGRKIEKELGYFPKTISYPVGSYNKTTMRLSKECGYSFGLAVNQTSYKPGEDDLFEIPRIELYNESWFKSRLRIDGVYGKLTKLLKYK